MDTSSQDRRWQGYRNQLVREAMIMFFLKGEPLIRGLDAHFKMLTFGEAQAPLAALDALVEYAPGELVDSFDPRDRDEFIVGTNLTRTELAGHLVYEVEQPFRFPKGELAFIHDKLMEAGARLGESHRAYGAHAMTHARFVAVCAHLAMNHPSGRQFMHEALQKQVLMAKSSVRARAAALNLRLVLGG